MGLLHQLFIGRVRLLLFELFGEMFLAGLVLALIIWLAHSVMVVLSGDTLASASSIIIHNVYLTLLILLVIILLFDSFLVTVLHFAFLLSHHAGEQMSIRSIFTSQSFWRMYGLRILFVGSVLVLFVLLFWLFGLSNFGVLFGSSDAEPDILILPFVLWCVLLLWLLWCSWGFDVDRIRSLRFWMICVSSFGCMVLVLLGLFYLHLSLFDLGYVWGSLVILVFILFWFVFARYLYLFFITRGGLK